MLDGASMLIFMFMKWLRIAYEDLGKDVIVCVVPDLVATIPSRTMTGVAGSSGSARSGGDVLPGRKLHVELTAGSSAWQRRQQAAEIFGLDLTAVRAHERAAGLAMVVYPPGTPAHIAYYLAVDNVDRRAEAATVNGARLLVPPFDAGDQGRVATLIDPVGAAFSLWQPRNFTGWKFPSQLAGAPHRMVLMCDQPEKARLFYGKMMGTPLTCADFIGTRGPGASVPQWELAVDVGNLNRVVAHDHGQDSVTWSEETGRRVVRLSSPEGLTFLVRCLQQ